MPTAANIVPVPHLLLSMFPDWANTEAKLSAAATLFRAILTDLQYSYVNVDACIHNHLAKNWGNNPAFAQIYQSERYQLLKKMASPRMGWKDFRLMTEVMGFENVSLTFSATLQAPGLYPTRHTISHHQD